MIRPSRRVLRAFQLEALEPRMVLSALDVSATLLIGLRPDATPAALETAVGSVHGQIVQSYPSGTSVVTLAPGTDRDGAILALRNNPAVSYAEADATYHAAAVTVTPTNGSFGAQLGLSNPNGVDIGATSAWAVSQGSSATVVAILDTGLDLGNPAFADRLWVNPNANQDGLVGDYFGYNYVSGNGNVRDDNGHGTHVTGIFGATGNSASATAGVDWNARIMPVKVLDSSGNGTTDSAVAGIYFAVQHGARVINASWGGGPYSAAMVQAINFAGSQNVIFVTAAGNDGTNSDRTPSYPGNYNLPNEITVGAVDSFGNLASFSDYGPHSVSIAAPGVNILSTVSGGSQVLSGTSMATPFVTGVVSLVLGQHPDWSATQVIQDVLYSAKRLPGLTGLVGSGGIVDAAQALGVTDNGPTPQDNSVFAPQLLNSPTIASTSKKHATKMKHGAAHPHRVKKHGFQVPGHVAHAAPHLG